MGNMQRWEHQPWFCSGPKDPVSGGPSGHSAAAQELKQMQEFADNHGIPSVYGRYKDLSVDPEIGTEDTFLCICGGQGAAESR
ncbi:hypothetical protein SRHO_G00109670 [Serrasalmus rhombeus]